MFKNYLKIAFRNIINRKTYSLVNISGLAISIAVCMLLIRYIAYELSYDTFHKNVDNIYRLRIEEWAGSHGPAGQAVKDAFPEVLDYTKINTIFANGVFAYGDKKFTEEKAFFASSSFLSIFSFDIIKGNPESALEEINSVVLTESTARKYFGNDNPIGKALTFAGRREYKVNGVIKDVPQNSHIKFDLLVSMSTLKGDWVNHWYFTSFHTYLLLRPDTNIPVFEKKLQAYFKEIEQQLSKDEHSEMSYKLQPLKSIHLHSNDSFEIEENGDIKTVYFLIFITILILLSAWINYINLCTAKSIDRAKEIGIRKVVGAFRTNVILQFLTESALFNIFAIILAFSVVQISMPFFSQITSIPNSFTPWGIMELSLILVTIFVLGISFSGFYPALVLSSFKPVNIIVGKLGDNVRSNIFRKSLVVFQFAVSIALIAGTLTVYRQIVFMKNQELGISINSTLVIKAPGIFTGNSQNERVNNIGTFKSEINKLPDIKNVAVSAFVPGEYVMDIHGGRRMNIEKHEAKEFHILSIDQDFLDCYQIDLLAGRNFSENYSNDNDKLLINKAALELLDFPDQKQAVGEKIYLEDQLFTIIGIVENYHQQSLKYDYVPLLITNNAFLGGKFSIKFHTKDLRQTIASIRDTWADVFPLNPFDYFFLDDHFNKQYYPEMKFGQVISIFTFLAILIGCLGLFGLSSLNVSVRIKEIGIRKILGASVYNIIVLLIKDFIKLIFIAVLIATPMTYFYYKSWLTNYAFRIEIGWWFFLIPVSLITMIALITIGYQSIKAAVANPVESLRYE